MHYLSLSLSRKRGFSLVELSIVLVILGLLVGGVLSGQSLIRAAELRAVTTEYSRYVTSVQSFRDKYFALPGDMTNATSFWGAMTNCGVASPSGTGTQTCNGNADGFVSAAAGGASQTVESLAFWQQLANAGLIEGRYTGIVGTAAANDWDIGTNIPRSKLSGGGWTTGSRTSYTTGSGVNFDGFWRNWFYVLGDGNGTDITLLLPEESWNIDTKLDDGKPGTGKAVARWTGCTDAASGAVLAANYLLSTTSKVCDIRFVEAF